MTTVLQLKPQSPSRGRPTKFTPERIAQVRNLVERGKSRDEIAEIIGVTAGSLQVTCSKLGISLRRPTGLLPRQQPRYQKNESTSRSSAQHETGSECANGTRPVSEGSRRGEARAGATPPANGWHRKFNQAVFALRMEYKGQERLTDLPIDEDMIGQLAMEAESRNMRIGDLIVALIIEIAKRDLFRLIGDGACPRREAAEELQPSAPEYLSA